MPDDAPITTAISRYLLPVIAGLAASHPRIRVLIREHETAEALQLLAADQADLALIYDFNLAPVAIDPYQASHIGIAGHLRRALLVDAQRTRKSVRSKFVTAVTA